MVNPQYLSGSTIAQVKHAFHANRELPSITLQKFFSEGEYKTLSKVVSKTKWEKAKDRMHYNHSVAPLPTELKKMLDNTMMKRCISAVLGREIKKIEGKLCMFGWKDYTLLYDEAVEKPGIDLIIDFTPQWGENAGGKIVYADGTGDSRNIPSSPNTLSVTIRKEGVQKFVQYCNHYAGKKKRILFLGTVE